MTFISYAQNYEDVNLYRALKDVRKGFYIDVGAQDPVADSVTKAFYELGWRGINIEPVDHWFNKLLVDRPEDHNLKVAAGAETGTIKLFEVVGTGMSTSAAGYAAQHASAGFEIQEREVPARRLDDICDEFGVAEVHFLKIDAEGAEGAVLDGIDLHRIRPWIILLESTEPNSAVPNHGPWEDSLTDRGYVFVHFDGLNRYYVPREREEQLKAALSVPPNYFDRFIRYSEWLAGEHARQMEAEKAPREDELVQVRIQNDTLRDSLAAGEQRVSRLEGELIASRDSLAVGEQRVSRLEGELIASRERLQALDSQLVLSRNSKVHLENRLSVHERELNGIYRSLSWRLTLPLRKGNLLVKRVKSSIATSSSFLARLPWRAAQFVLLSTLAHLRSRPARKAKLARLLERLPRLQRYLRRFSRFLRLAASSTWTRGPVSAPELLSPKLSLSQRRTGSLAAPLKTGSRVIYYFVDHTILCPVNTGMQRVTRRLGRALLEQGERVRFVKWNEQCQQLVLLNQAELVYLSQWHGPSLSTEDLLSYPFPDDPVVALSKQPLEEGHWLVVPEVTHITYHPRPITLEIIVAGRRLGLKTAFIFYDAIPLRRPELATMAPNHEIYIQQLLLADLVVPISNWSARDLVSFFHTHEDAMLSPIPKVTVIPLPGESQLAPRVIVPAGSETVRKLILSVGSIELRKNQIALIHAFERFCAEYPEDEWELILVGSPHPDVIKEINLAVKRTSRIHFLAHIPDAELDVLYRSCAFTVFPSVEEGFGLPILESLWYAKPCICADFGAMGEVAKGGGCFTVNVKETGELVRAITSMTKEPGLLEKLSHEAASRPITTWAGYAKQFIKGINYQSDPINQMGVIYYWVDHTCTYPGNSGIQRVVRGLARALLEIGLKLMPVKWDGATNQLIPPTHEELQHLARWNGPEPGAWTTWAPPLQAAPNDWLLIPELVSDPAGPDGKVLKRFAATHGLRGAWIFYDAIPWKMPEVYPPEATRAHSRYMEGLNEFERIFAISEHSRCDLTHFLAATKMPSPNLDDRIRACLLPGEFMEAPRVRRVKPSSSEAIKVLCVCTIEPRKNHLGLLQAFAQVVTQTHQPVELVMVGTCPFPELALQVNRYIEATPGISWEQNADDARLRELYTECDFTVYPSLEEGFGLPILESLWNARPCICRNKGAMTEVAEGGGCLTVETGDPPALAHAILSLVKDNELRSRLAREAVSRSFKTWHDYAREVATYMATERYVPMLEPQSEVLNELEFYNQFVNLQPRPLLSICITTYNRAEWLALSLKNLARLVPNPHAEIEIVVCDNTSTDHTPKVVEPYLLRPDFRYHRNPENIGMLGNLRATAHHARGQYIWILGDDDVVEPGSIERVLQTIQRNPGIALIYLNYAYTRQDDAKMVTDLDRFLNESTPVVTSGPDVAGPVHLISTKSENFFTAIYCLVFRRDHALRAYSQNTDGRPFSTMLTCIPTTYYVLNYMMNEPAYWVGDPQVVVNLNVSWMKYASIWILERLPEAHDLAEKLGASPNEVDRCRINHLPHVFHWYKEIFENEQELDNVYYFSASRLVTRMKHLEQFREKGKILRDIYNTAHVQGHAGASIPTSQVFTGFENL